MGPTGTERTRRAVIRLSVLALGMVASGMALAEAHLGKALDSALAKATPAAALVGARAAHCTHLSGTSMATPHAAGIAASLSQANLGLAPMEVREVLSATANSMAGRQRFEVGSGHVDAYEAVGVAEKL